MTREGAGNDELPHFIDKFLAVVAPSVHVHAEHARLNLAGIDRQCWRGADKASANLRAARLRCHPEILFYAAVKFGECFRRRWRAGRDYAFQAREIKLLAGFQAGFLHHLYICRASSKQRRAGVGGKLPEELDRRMGWVAVI
jgi:hypothetical protein